MQHPASPAPAHPWRVLAVLCLSVFLVSVDNTIVNVALPTLAAELSAGTSALQWVVDGYALVFAALLLLGGHLGDRFGRLRMLELGLVVFGAAALLAASADSIGELVGARALMGAGAALVFPATLALLITSFPGTRERATAIGIWSAVTGLSVAVGPVTGGLLLEHFAWGSVFLVKLPLVLVALLAGRLVLRESRERAPSRFDGIGVLASVVGVGLLVWTTIEAPNHGWASGTTVAGYTGAALALAGFVLWELRRPDPLLDVRLFTNPRVSAGSGAIALAFFALFGFIFLVTQYFQAVLGYGPLSAGLRTLPFAIVIGVTSPLAIIAMRRFGTTVVVTTGLLVMAVGFALAAGSGVDSAYWGRIVASMILMAGGLGLVTSPATEAVMGALRTDQAGAGSAVNDTVREVGGTLGVAVVGSVMSTVYAATVQDGLVGLPEQVREAAGESVVAGLTIAAGSSDPTAVDTVRQAFVDGLSAGSWVCAGACVLGALAVAAWLPAQARDAEVAAEPVPATTAG
jgi:EmrB/QacA subfamily drug resistance transporter